MALGTTPTEKPLKKIYLSITHGKVTKYDKESSTSEEYSYIEGTLESIYIKERTFKGVSSAKFWYVDLRDGEELYSISFPYISGVFKSLILSLASDTGLTARSPLRIEPYEANGFTKLTVFSEGIKLGWITRELPPLEKVVVGSQTITDDTKRMEYITTLVNEILSRIQKSL